MCHAPPYRVPRVPTAMIEVVKRWFENRFHDEEAVILTFILLIGVVLIMFLGQIMTPVIAALVMAYLLQGVVSQFNGWGMPHILSVTTATLLLVVTEAVFVLLAATLLLGELENFAQELPKLIELMQERLASLQSSYPEFLDPKRVQEWTDLANAEIAGFGQWVLTFSQANIPNILSFMLYLVLVPVFVFFLLKDKDVLLGWFSRMLPEERPLLLRVWFEMDKQMANYVRGKVIEMFIVGGVTFFAFSLMGLNYAALLALGVGVSVIVPYVGAMLVTIPVALVAYLQWGLAPSFFWLMGWYILIQVLDGNALVPLLFSEAVNLHPIAILLAIMFFGGVWGLWGVFFAIPLATLMNAVINAWPTKKKIAVTETSAV